MERAKRNLLGGRMENAAFNKLVEDAIRGDHEAFAQVYESCSRKILYWARLYMKNEAEAEDAAQEAVIKMYRDIGQLKYATRFNFWMYSVIKNVCLMMKRKNSMAKDLLNISDYENVILEKRLEFLPEKYAESNEAKELILGIIETLPPQRQEATRLYYYSDMQKGEIAEIMGISPNAVSSTIAKARKDIKRELEKRTGKKIEKVRGFVFAPVLTKVFDYQEQKMVPDGQVQNFIESCRVMLEAAPPMVAGTVAAANAAPHAAFGASTFFKVIGVIVAGAVITVSGTLYAMNTTGRQNAQDPTSSSVLKGESPQLLPGTTDGDVDINGTPENQPSPAGQEPGTDAAAGIGGPTGTGEAGGEAAQTEQAGSETPEKTQQATNPPGNQTSTYIATPVSGALVLKDSAGNTMPGDGFLNGVSVSLIDAKGKTVASATAGSNGAFSFSPVSIAATTEYALEAALPESSGLAATHDNPQGRTIIRVAPGSGTSNAALYVTYTHPPDGSVVLYGGDCECGHVNPERIVINDSGVRSVSQSWQILKDGSAVMTGTGAAITSELQTLADGAYTLRYTHTNSVGNSEEIKKDFVIYSGPIEPNQFA